MVRLSRLQIGTCCRRHCLGLLVAFFAALLRLHRQPTEFTSSDAAHLPALVMKLACSSKPLGESLQQLLLYKLGGVQPLALYAHANLALFTNNNLNETQWVYPAIIVSTAAVFVAYLLIHELYSSRPLAAASALLLAVSPIHIMVGRHLGAPWAFEIFFQLMLLLAGLRLCKRPTESLKAVFYICLSLYFWCGNQMLAIVPALGFLFACGYWHQAARSGVAAFLVRTLASPWLLGPLVSATALGHFTLMHEGHLAHALFARTKELGWHWPNWHADAVRNIGFIPTWLGLLGLVLAGFMQRGLFTWERLIWVYCICYTLPFWTFVGRATTMTTGYTVYGLTGLLLLLPAALTKAGHRRAALPVSLSIALLLLIGTGGSVFRYYDARPLGFRPFQGSYTKPIGVSAAAVFIKRDSEKRTLRVFSDASGGGGVEPPVARLYLRSLFFSKYDADKRAIYKKFSRHRNQIGYVLAQPENDKLLRRYFPGFRKQAIVVSGGPRGKKLLEVYSRKEPPEIALLHADEGVAQYNTVFPTLCAM